MAVYTITLLDYASYLTAGSLATRCDALSEWLFEDNGLDAELKKIFEKAFVRHYLFYEMGFETPALFRDRVNARILEIAPYYNTLWLLNQKLLSWDFMEDEIAYTEQGASNSKADGSFSENFSENRNESENTENTTKSTDTQTGTITDDSTENGTGKKTKQATEDESAQRNHTDEYTMTFDKTTNTVPKETLTTTVTGNDRQTTNQEGSGWNVGKNTNSGKNTDINNTKQITNANGALSQFPQANVISTNDYYSQGNESSQQVQDTGTVTHELGGILDTTGSFSNKNYSEVTNSPNNQTVATQSGDRKVTETYGDQKKDEINEKSIRTASGSGSETEAYGNEKKGTNTRDLLDILERAESLSRNLQGGEKNERNGTNQKIEEAKNQIIRSGRLTRRPVTQIIEGITEIYKNIPMMMIKECSDLFMGIW